MARKITNEANFPQPLFAALAHDGYTGGGGDTSITRLINPPRISTLRFIHEDEITEDATDRIWAVMGQAGHKVMENAANEHMKVEETLAARFTGVKDKDGNDVIWKVTGTPDLYDPSDLSIYDYKFTSVWSLLMGDKPEWERQVNMQAMLHRIHKKPVEHGYIVALLRDWSRRKAAFEKDYPAHQAQVLAIPMWPQQEVIDFTKRRVILHQKARFAYIESGHNDSVLPECTNEDRWYRGAGFAVKKQDSKGKVNKKADRVFDNMTDAKQYIIDNSSMLPKGKTFAPVESRPGQNIRCMDYCDVWQWCSFGRKVHEEMNKTADAATSTSTEDSEE